MVFTQNHSCLPNCRVSPVYVNEPDIDRPLIAFYATRDVKAGEELTVDYWGDVGACRSFYFA